MDVVVLLFGCVLELNQSWVLGLTQETTRPANSQSADSRSGARLQSHFLHLFAYDVRI